MWYESGKHQEMGITHSPLYHLVVPRPIAWISTRIGTHTNLAPMSYFTVVRDREPEMIAFCVGHRTCSCKVRLAMECSKRYYNSCKTNWSILC